MSADRIARQPRGRWIAAAAVLLLSVSAPADARKKKDAKVKTAEDLLIVDCRLPGQYRQLGNGTAYLTPQRPIRTTAVDCRIRGGEYVAFDRASYSSALEVWQPLASQGDAEAQTYVGEIFEKGLAGTPDYESAALWYKRAAEQGHPRAQVNLAYLYEEGRGVPRDPEAARRWYGKAAGIPDDVILDSEQLAKQLGQQVEDLEARLAAATSELDAARGELQRRQDELDGLRRQLEEARAQPAGRDPEQVERLENEVAKRGQEVAAGAEDLEKRRRALAELRAKLAEARSGSGAGTGPAIEIIRPDVLSTRGPMIVPVPSGATEMEIRGQVTAPAGVGELRVDERAVAVGAKGLFETRVPFAVERREVELVASDRLGRETHLTLILQTGPAPPPPDSAPPRPGTVPPVTAVAGGSSGRALVIGVADYQYFSDLTTADRDAEEVAAVLAAKYGFRVKVLKDASKLAITGAFVELIDELTPDDDLIIYYAGHGRIETEGERGFWIPSDAKPDEPRTWLPNEAISNYLDSMPARHVLVVSDSCYSGTLTRSGLARVAADAAGDQAAPLADRRTRTVLTSGGLQPVLDVGGGEHSLFAGAFLRVLELFDGTLTGESLHRKVAARVVGRADELGVDQVPDYAPIHFAGHEAGDFVLVPRREPAASAPAASR
jgi:Caspase domain/Sel1 repeat